MITHKKFLIFLLLIGTSISMNAEEKEVSENFFIFDFQQTQERGLDLTVIINNSIEIVLENVSASGYLEVYSILGVKVTSVNLKTIMGHCPLDLPKGIYILKAGKIAQKIIVR